MLDYFANTTAYAKNCVNKAKPKLHCNGKCQMMKKIQQEEKKNQQIPERKSETNDLVFFTGYDYLNPEIFYTRVPKPVSFERGLSPTDRSFDFFHPPQTCLS